MMLDSTNFWCFFIMCMKKDFKNFKIKVVISFSMMTNQTIKYVSFFQDPFAIISLLLKIMECTPSPQSFVY